VATFLHQLAGPGFTPLAPPDDNAWSHAAAEIATTLHMPLTTHHVASTTPVVNPPPGVCRHPDIRSRNGEPWDPAHPPLTHIDHARPYGTETAGWSGCYGRDVHREAVVGEHGRLPLPPCAGADRTDAAGPVSSRAVVWSQHSGRAFAETSPADHALC